MNVADFDYELPEELIAQKPTEKRQDSRMMVMDRTHHQILHKHFYDFQYNQIY
jgi:S-adenosylmethionine:tRNA ribosyltransferase-isomerase